VEKWVILLQGAPNREKRRSKDYGEYNRGFFPRQGVSTNLLAFIDSKI